MLAVLRCSGHANVLIPWCCCYLLQYFGVDVNTGGVVNTYDAFVWEPALVKLNAIQVRLSLRD
jgi:hypothetical protein